MHQGRSGSTRTAPTHFDRTDEARALYLKYLGTKNVQGDKSWEAVILEDFAELSKAGLMHPLMNEIETKFAARG